MKVLKNIVAVGALSAVVAMTGLTGCMTNKKAKETGRTPSQVSTDNAISKRVASALQTAPVYKYPTVQVKAFNGDVQLSGFVHTDAQKQEAQRIAQQIPGVNRVHDDLVVQPLTPTGRTGNQGDPNKPYQAPIITPPQEGTQQQPQQGTQPQPSESVQPQPSESTQPK